MSVLEIWRASVGHDSVLAYYYITDLDIHRVAGRDDPWFGIADYLGLRHVSDEKNALSKFSMIDCAI